MKNAVGREIPEELIKKGWEPFQGNQYREGCTYQRVGPMVKARVMPQGGKVVSSLREAIEKTGLCDGMTISFHHHFRDGDYIVDKVMREIADMGLKDIHLATTSIGGAADVVADYIEQGIVTGLTTSGIRARIGEVVSQGQLKEPAIIRTHGGRIRAIEYILTSPLLALLQAMNLVTQVVKAERIIAVVWHIRLRMHAMPIKWL